jgi:hypothetical protein
MTDLRIYDIPASQVTDWWSLVTPVLERAVKQNPHMDMPGLLQTLLAQFAQLIVVTREGDLVAVVVMERHVYPNHVVGNILFLAGAKGAYKRISDVVPHLEKWAKEHGCDRIALLGRPGLSRLVKRHGGESIQLIHAWLDL